VDAAARLAALRVQLPPACRLLAVSKGQSAQAIRALAEAGQRSFAENRVQEAGAKQAELADLPGLDWHFIGRLQANKVRPVLQRFSTVHSLDSLPLAERMARIAVEEGVAPAVFAQVKLRPDPSKGGFSAEDLRALWPQLSALAPLRLVGLMAMAPLGLTSAQRRELFSEVVALGRELGVGEFSMGMSGDWPEAAAAGSTWVRIGSALFAPRPLDAATTATN
jgi:pyridoxal phosphate enzyme (YggS family)